jgi:hypothetical protein
VAGGRPSQTRNHHTLTPAWEPWGSAYGYDEDLIVCGFHVGTRG